MVYLTFAVIGLGGRGVIKTWTKVAPLHDDVRSHLSGSSAIQPLAASEESWHRYYFIFFYIIQRFTYSEKNRDDLLQYNGINFTSRKNGSNFR